MSGLMKQFNSLSLEVKVVISLAVAGFAIFGMKSHGCCCTKKCSPTVTSNNSVGCIDSNSSFDVVESLPEKDTDVFEFMFERILKEIIADLTPLYEMPEESVKYVEEMIRYNCWGGKMNRGLAVMSVQREFAKVQGREPLVKERMQAAALGWCIEYLQAFFLVADDVMDDSVTRRGQPCWFRKPEVKMIAINDAFILESCVYKILKRYFGSESCYTQLVDLFLEVTRQTEFGQLLDLTSQPLGGPIDLNRFTSGRYFGIVRYKTAFYSFYIPVALGMIMSGVTAKKHYDTAREILLIMGEYFQVQDDYLDCYGSPEVIGKIGTDIQDNKCSWLVVQALGMVSAEQRVLLEENYGKHDMECVQRVKQLYADLNLEGVYHAYEEESYNKLQKLLSGVTELPKEIFEFLLRKIYKRSK